MLQIKPMWFTRSFVILGFALVTLGSMAQESWRRTYGGYGFNIGSCVRQTLDGGFIIAGSTGSFGEDGDAYLIKVDGSGIPEWSEVYGGDGNQTAEACRVLDDGYVIAGTTSSGAQGGYDMLLVRTDFAGNVLWERTYGTAAWDLCTGMDVADDGVVLAGITYSENAGDALVIKTDFNGDTLWTKLLGTEYFDQALGITVSSSNEFFVVGVTSPTNNDEQAFLAKLSADGDLLWMNTYGDEGPDYLQSAVETSDGAIACSGGTRSYSDVWQILMVKVDGDGGLLWQEQYGSMGDSEGREIQEDMNGNLAVASYNSYMNAGGKDMVLFLVSSTGDFILGKNYGGPGEEYGASLEPLDDGGYIIVGTAEDYGPGVRSIYAVRSLPDGSTDDDTVYEMFDPLPIDEHPIPARSFFHPNPSTGDVFLDIPTEWAGLMLYNSLGQQVRSWGKPFERLDLRGLGNGMYFLRGTDRSGRVITAPLVLQRP